MLKTFDLRLESGIGASCPRVIDFLKIKRTKRITIPIENSIAEHIKKKNESERTDKLSIEKLIFKDRAYKVIHRISAVRSIDKKLELFKTNERTNTKNTMARISTSEKKIQIY